MKYLGPISDDKDIVNKEYVDEAIAGQIFYGTIDSYSGSLTRTYAISADNYTKKTGNIIIFTWPYTPNTSVDVSIALNVNSTGRYSLYRSESNSTATYDYLNKGEYVYFAVFTGSAYKLLDRDTWTRNSSSQNGYVPAGGAYTDSVWTTNQYGVPDWRKIRDVFYPVGSYYETSDSSFDPNVVWGGTWVLDSEGKVTVGYDSDVTAFNQIGKTGGVKDAIVPYHRHSVAKFNTGGMSANSTHSHGIFTKVGTRRVGTTSSFVGGGEASNDYSHGVIVSGAASYLVTDSLSTAHTHEVSAHNTDYEGTSGNATDANLQPYIVVNRWHRTA